MSAIEQIKQREKEKRELDEFRKKEAEANRAKVESQLYTKGVNDAYRAVEQELYKRQGPIVSGSPEDLEMQDNIQRGIEFTKNQPPMGSGLLTDLRKRIANKLKTTSNDISEGLAVLLSPTEEIERRDALMGQQMQKELENNARNRAFNRAKAMGDMSENTINNLMVEELNKVEGRR